MMKIPLLISLCLLLCTNAQVHVPDVVEEENLAPPPPTPTEEILEVFKNS